MLTINNKGGEQLSINNFRYKIKRRNNKSIIWVCSGKICLCCGKSSNIYDGYLKPFNLKIENNHTNSVNLPFKD